MKYKLLHYICERDVNFTKVAEPCYILRLIGLIGLLHGRYVGGGVELGTSLPPLDQDVHRPRLLLGLRFRVQGVHFDHVVQTTDDGLRRPNNSCVSVHLKERTTPHYKTEQV